MTATGRNCREPECRSFPISVDLKCETVLRIMRSHPIGYRKRRQQILYFAPGWPSQGRVLHPHLDEKFPHLFGLRQTAEQQMFEGSKSRRTPLFHVC